MGAAARKKRDLKEEGSWNGSGGLRSEKRSKKTKGSPR